LLPTIDAADLAGLAPAELLSRAVSTIIRELGIQGIAIRNDIVSRLAPTRSAVFGYAVLHGHGSGALSGLCAELQHRVMDPNFFASLDNSVAEIGDDELRAILRRLQAEVSRAIAALGDGPEGWERSEALVKLLDPATMRGLDEEYVAVQSASMDRLARYIRAHADEVFAVVG
jgi:hypothetical protein